MEKKDIFENAKFGDKFITRDGRMAIYIQSIDGRHILLSQQFPSGYTVLPNGCFFRDVKREYDIVGRWQEPIDDEKACDKIKRSCINCVWPTRFDSMGTCFLRCEENPNVCDHPFCVELEEAASMCCEQFSSTEVCTHCRYMGVNQCNNSKRATFDGDMVVLRHCNYNDKACEFFEREI